MSEVENSLPDNWALCKLGDVMKLRNGYAFKSKDYSAEGVPLIRISDINNNIVSTERAAKIPVDLVHEGYLIEDGDIRIAMTGVKTGKSGVYKGKEKILQKQRVGNLKIIDEAVVSKGYRNYYVMSLRKAIEGAAYGGAQPNIAAKDIDEFPFPLAPPEQQKRIVAKIEELFSHIDAGIAALNKAKQLLKKYRQSVLKAAVTGELTKHLPSRQAGWRDPLFRNKCGKLVPKKSDKYFAYVLECENGSLYKGFSKNLYMRIDQHLSGQGAKWTKEHKPVSIIHFEEFETEKEAIEREKYFKSGSGREWINDIRTENNRKFEPASQLLELSLIHIRRSRLTTLTMSRSLSTEF